MNSTGNQRNQSTPGKESSSSGTLSLEKLGLLIANRRTSMNMSQEELGLRSGIHRSYVSEIERGQRNFTIKVLAQISECLNLSMSQLLSESTKRAAGD